MGKSQVRKVEELEFKTRAEFDQYIKDRGKELSIAIVGKKSMYMLCLYLLKKKTIFMT